MSIRHAYEEGTVRGRSIIRFSTRGPRQSFARSGCCCYPQRQFRQTSCSCGWNHNVLRSDNNNLHRILAAAERRVEALRPIRWNRISLSAAFRCHPSRKLGVDRRAVYHPVIWTHWCNWSAVIKLFNEDLNIAIIRQDISAIQRLPKRRKYDMTPAPVVVLFANLRTHDTTYRLRLAFKYWQGLYINEHVTKSTATLFHDARMLIKISTWTANGVVRRQTTLPLDRTRWHLSRNSRRLSQERANLFFRSNDIYSSYIRRRPHVGKLKCLLSTWTANGVVFVTKSNDPSAWPIKVATPAEMQKFISWTCISIISDVSVCHSRSLFFWRSLNWYIRSITTSTDIL